MEMGVSNTNEISNQYSVRGGNFDENAVYVNGIEIYRPLLIRASQQEGLSFINPDMVGEVQFSAGGFEAKYGDKMSSVLDVKYKTPEKFEGRVSLGTHGGSLYIGSKNRKFTQTHGFRFKSNQYLVGDKLKLKNGKPLLKGLTIQGDYTNYFLDYQTFMTYNFSKEWNLEFLGNISMNRYKFQPHKDSITSGQGLQNLVYTADYTGQEIDMFATFFGSFSLNFKPNEQLKLSFIASAFSTNEKETYDLTAQYRLSQMQDDGKNRSENLLGIGTFHKHARNRLSASVFSLAHRGESQLFKTKVQWGISLDREMIFDNIREYELHDSSKYSLPRNDTSVRVFYSLASQSTMISTRLQAYLQQAFSLRYLNSNWIFNVGVRTNYWSFNDEWLFSPRLSIACLPEWKHDFAFRFAAGLYYQPPFYKEVRLPVLDEATGTYNIVLNNEITAQRSGHILFGTDYFFRAWSRPFKLTGEFYYKPADRVIPYYVDNVQIRYMGENLAWAYTAGFDVRLYGEFVPGADSWIQFSMMHSQENLYNDNYEVFSTDGNSRGWVEPTWIPRPNEQRYAVSLYFQDYVPDHPEYKVNLKVVWADGFPYGNPHKERYQAIFRTKAYRRVDIGASRDFKTGREKFMSKQKLIKAFSINLDLLNLFDIENVSSYFWITDINNINYAMPNYLTRFMVNLRVAVDF
jgi:hypothetical protein